MICTICGSPVGECNHCGKEFQAGDSVLCYRGRHYCSPLCAVNGLGIGEGKVM